MLAVSDLSFCGMIFEMAIYIHALATACACFGGGGYDYLSL